jgi:transposase, IS5 family
MRYWRSHSRLLDAKAPRIDSKVGGRPPYATELMVRMIVLQQFFGLSDDQMVYPDQ